MSDVNLDAELDPEEPGEETPEPKVEPEKTPELEEKPEPTVPVAAHVAQRETLTEQRDFWRQVAEKNAKPADDLVDLLAEPEKIHALIDQKVGQRMEGLSKTYAIRAHGKALVDKAYSELVSHGSQAEQATMSASDDPWGEVVDWHKGREAMAEIGNDPAAWRQRETERIRKELLADAVVKEVKGIAPAPSLAGSTNLGPEKDDGKPREGVLAAVLDD